MGLELRYGSLKFEVNILELVNLCLGCKVVKMKIIDKCAKERKRERWNFLINVNISILKAMIGEIISTY